MVNRLNLFLGDVPAERVAAIEAALRQSGVDPAQLVTSPTTGPDPGESLLFFHAQLLDCVQQAVIATDLEGRVTYWNRYAERLYGWPAAEAIGQNILDLTPAPQMAKEAGAIMDQLRRGESWSGEFQVRDRSGRAFIAHVTDTPILNADGKLVGVIGVSSDVSDMKNAEDALRRRSEQLADAQRLAHVGSVERNYRTGEEIWTDEIYRIFEIDPSTKPDIDLLFELIHPEEAAEVQKKRRETTQSGRPFEEVARAVLPSGGIKYIRATGQVIFENGEPSRLLAAMQDITEEKRAEDEMRRRAMQQAALAQVGHLALSNAGLGFIFAQAAETVRQILDTDYCDVYKCVANHLLLVGGAGWPEGTIGAAEADGGRHSQAGYTIQAGAPVIVKNLATETRFTPSPRMLQDGIVSGLTVIIDGGGEQAWGVLGAHSRKHHDFSGNDVDFLRALAATLGQAIERRRAEVELQVRAVQQSAMAELGHRVLISDIDQDTLERACELVMDGLSVEFATFLQSDDNGKSLRFRAGQVWLEPPDPIPLDASQAGYSITTGRPLVVPDYTTEKRFKTELFTEYGIRAGLTVPIVGPNRKFGVLTAQTRSAKAFSSGDVNFMDSLGAVLADALTREGAKNALVESEARFRSVVEGASEIIFSLSARGEILSLNPAFEAITGWRCDQWIGRPFEGLMLPEYLEEMQALFASIIQEPRSIRIESHIRGRKGQEILLAAAISPKVVRGDVIELYGFARDVTDERRLEGERNRVTRQLQLILDSTDEGIYAVDMYGRCTIVNRSAAKLLAASPDWLIGSDMHSIIHPKPPGSIEPEAYDCGILQVVRTAQSHSSRDDIFCRADGAPFPVEYTASPIIDAGVVKGAVVAFSDVSARRKLESKLEQANRLSSLGRLAATVAHEFNNVLMGIAPFAEVLKRETLSERGGTAVDQIARSVKRGKRITEDILRFTQPAEPVLVTFDAAAWLNTVALEARSLIGPKFTIEVDAPPEPVRIVGDAGQLHQSFINLILNARDAMAHGGKIAICIAPRDGEARFDFAAIDAPHRFAHFIVEDKGHGMSPETLRHIFEPLFTTKKNGTGLGLAVTQHVIARHGGEIFVESAVGVGTKFHVFIPLEEDRTGVAALPAGSGKAERRRYHRVLLVEDEKPVATGLAALLELEGMTVKIVETGRDVLPAIGESRPDVVVLDIGLPDIDGTKVFASIAHSYPDLPVVFSSGHADESKLEAHLSKPHVGFLLKPYDIDTLLAAMDRVVG